MKSGGNLPTDNRMESTMGTTMWLPLKEILKHVNIALNIVPWIKQATYN